MNKTNLILSITTGGLGAILLGSMPGMADTTLFLDDFDGPTLNPVWQASLPNANIAFLGTSAAYLGVPNYSFKTLGGYSVLRPSNSLSDFQRVGWSSSTIYSPSAYTYEVRFNTLVQSTATSIDDFIEVWILDPTNPNRYDMVSLFGAAYSTQPQFAVGSSIDNSFGSQFFSYQNNTWYRLVIQDSPGQNIRVALDDDSGTELIGQTLNHTEGAYGAGFELALSQGMGQPLGTYPEDVAVDYAKLTMVPEPTSLAFVAAGAFLWLAASKRDSARSKG